MNPAETALVLDRLAGGLDKVVPEGAVDLWSKAFSGVPADVVADAVDIFLCSAEQSDRFWPTPGRIQVEVAFVHRERVREERQQAVLLGAGPNPDCGFCHGDGWFETEPKIKADSNGEMMVYEMWRPCEPCNPVAFTMWLAYKAQARKAPRSGPRETFEFNIAERIAEAKRALDPDLVSS